MKKLEEKKVKNLYLLQPPSIFVIELIRGDLDIKVDSGAIKQSMVKVYKIYCERFLF